MELSKTVRITKSSNYTSFHKNLKIGIIFSRIGAINCRYGMKNEMQWLQLSIVGLKLKFWIYFDCITEMSHIAVKKICIKAHHVCMKILKPKVWSKLVHRVEVLSWQVCVLCRKREKFSWRFKQSSVKKFFFTLMTITRTKLPSCVTVLKLFDLCWNFKDKERLQVWI